MGERAPSDANAANRTLESGAVQEGKDTPVVLSEQVKTISQVESALDKIKSKASSFPDAIRSGFSEFTEFRRDAVEGDPGLV